MKCFLQISALLLLLTFTAGTSAQAANWKIGTLLCLSGECAAEGDSSLKGAQLAVQELNAKGGVLGEKLELVVQDTNEAVSGSKTVAGYRQLRTDQDIHYLLGPTWTPGGLALIPILIKDTDVIITSPSLGVKAYHEAADTIFNSRGTDETTTRQAARYAFESGLRNMAIFSSEQPWEHLQAETFQSEFEKLGGKIAIMVEAIPTAASLSAEALKIVRTKPDGIFFAVLIQQAIAANDLKKLNYSGPQFAALIDDARISEAKGALEGTIYFGFQTPTSEFKDLFTKTYGKPPEIAAATAYDAIFAYAKAVEKAATFNVTTVKHTLLDIEFKGASGDFHYDEKGCVKRVATGWKVAGQGFVPVK